MISRNYLEETKNSGVDESAHSRFLRAHLAVILGYTIQSLKWDKTAPTKIVVWDSF